MKSVSFITEKIHQFSDHVANRFYTPTATGSHDIGLPMMGHVASSSVEHTNWPEAARTPMLRIDIKPHKAN